jgi:ribosomal protein L40E
LICPKCQAENPEDARFCEQCGASLERTCPACGDEVGPTARFCKGCGHSLTEPAPTPTPTELSFDEKLDKIQRYLPGGLTEKILSQRNKIEGERRHVTVMFCDMVGSTPLAEKLDPEEVYAISGAHVKMRCG